MLSILNIRNIVFSLNILLYSIGMFKLVCSTSTCEEPINIYEDLRCTPIYSHSDSKSQSESSCPRRYDCSHLLDPGDSDSDNDKKCYFDGKWYAIGEYVQVPSVCGVGSCKCTESLNFECTRRECPYMHLPDVDNCFLAYGFDECCAQSIRCVSDWTNMTTCKIHDTVYLAGELFPSPLDRCKLCVCTEDFDTKYGRNVCRSVPCRLELFNSADLLSGCAPVYYDATDCCPIDVRCPSDDDINALALEDLDLFTDEYCIYGSVKVSLGLRLVNTQDYYGHLTKTVCTCQIPPFMTCYRTYY